MFNQVTDSKYFKFKNILLVLLLIVAMCACSKGPQLPGTYSYGQYKDKNHAIIKKNAESGNEKFVVFIGNSITEQWEKADPDFFTSNNYVNRGISGQTSPQILLRFRQDVLSLKPTAVVINAGINDVAENTGPYYPEFTLDCIRSMADLAEFNNIKVILSSVTPADSFSWRRDIENITVKVDSLNALIKAYANEKGHGYIDYNTPLRDENGGMKREYRSVDEIHVNKEGYKVMEKAAKEIIDKMLR